MRNDLNSIYRTIGASNHTEGDRETNDYYATDPAAVDELLKVEVPIHDVWECACGEGHISERLKSHGFNVVSTDLIDRGYGDGCCDFLEAQTSPFENKAFDIITNPPYKFGTEFVLKALDLIQPGQKVFMFLKLTFLEGQQRYADLFRENPPKRIYVFSRRISCMKNGNEKYGRGAVCYAWYVWQKGHTGATEIRWVNTLKKEQRT